MKRVTFQLTFLLLLVIGTGAVAAAQPVSHYGRRFLIAFPDTTRNRTGPIRNTLPDDARLVIFSTDTATVRVTAPGFSRQITVVPDSSSTVILTDPTDRPTRIFFDLLNTASSEIIGVVADKPVAVYCQFVTTFGSEGFTPLPVERWGTEYFAMSLRNHLIGHVYFQGVFEEQWAPADGPGELTVIAAEDGTDVTIDATADLIGPRQRTITLNAGEAYRIETDSTLRKNNAFDTTARDLSGTHISASKPIAVISGNTRTDGGRGADIPPVPPTGNSLRNTAIEWLLPAAAAGKSFVYRPIFPVDDSTGEELIRVYATSPGITTITTSVAGITRTINQGEFAHFGSFDLRSADTNQPFAISTDQPAQAMVITGSLARTEPHGNEAYFSTTSYSPAMVELVPREHWITAGRFRTFDYPASLTHYLVVTAEERTELWMDGERIPFDPQLVPGTLYRHVRIRISAGDHTLRSANGRFNAIAYGYRQGYEAYKPAGAKRKDDGDAGIAAPHPSLYEEYISIAYGFPVAGFDEDELPPDSLSITQDERCDSTVVVVERADPLWSATPVSAILDPASTNVTAQITPIHRSGVLAGYRIRFTPINPALDASGRAIVVMLPGDTTFIPYRYAAHAVSIAPDPVDLLGIPAGVAQSVPLTLTSRTSFPIRITGLRLKNGTVGFSLPDLSMLPKSLNADQGFMISLAFTGASDATRYRDTLIVEVEGGCGSFEFPLSARTAPADLTPVPLISGYDWKRRVVGSSNDTLSIIANAGSRAFTISEVAIINDAVGAFALAPPDWRSISVVQPGERYPTGIRFIPPGIGTFTADIILVTTDGDTARDELRGVGVLPDLTADDIELGAICLRLGGVKDTALVIANNGDVPLRIDSLQTGGADAALLRIDTTGLNLPRTLPPGQTLIVPVHINASAPGTINASVQVYANDVSITARIAGNVISCSNGGLTVDDHDFDSVFITLTKPGTVTLHNTGGGDGLVTGMSLIDDTASAFRIVSPAAPFIVPDGDSLQVAVEFRPMSIGLKTARIEFKSEVGTLYSNLRGVGKKLIVPAFIRRDYHGKPGEIVRIHVELDTPVIGMPLDSLDLALGYRSELIDYLGLADTITNDGWAEMATLSPDSLHFRLLRTGITLDTGHILSLRFLTRITLLDSSELPFTIESGLPYLEFIERPGFFHRDSICGISYRLWEYSFAKLRLEQNAPNPATSGTAIEYEIPFDNRTTLVVYDMLGRERLRLVDGLVEAGMHIVEIPDRALAAGRYFYRLRSGEYDLQQEMIVE